MTGLCTAQLGKLWRNKEECAIQNVDFLDGRNETEAV
jgi:hypothetical protein